MAVQRRLNSFHKGTRLKTLFTNSPRRRYGWAVMILLIAAAIASAPPQTPASAPVGASAQAHVAIRIISGVELHFGDGRTSEGLLPRDSIIRSAEGDQPANLIEFQ
jgi:hypothetical protein